MDRREKQKEVFVKLVNKQLEPHNVTYEHVKSDPNWYMNYRTTPENEREFIDWGVEMIQEDLGMNRKMAEQEMSWFILQWGLTTIQPEGENVEIEVELKNNGMV